MEANRRNEILEGRTVLGVEFGSTRIKAVLIGEDNTLLASGNHDWENALVEGIWTYALEDVWTGLQDSFAALASAVRQQYDAALTKVGAIGISAMMHGYLVFDQNGGQLVPFRTWRNTSTQKAAEELTKLLSFNIPQRWSIAHLYQAALTEEPHIQDIAYITTLAGYVHWRLTGKKVLGVGDASGMFPIDSTTCNFNAKMLSQLGKKFAQKGLPRDISDILPRVLCAGEYAGSLTEEGAKLIDPSGRLQAGAVLCPPEGDAGTGMVATNSVAPRTGNVSAGTSIFAMVVLERALSEVHAEIDMVTTPAGKPVAMVHCNNCTSDLDAWVKVFGEFSDAAGAGMTKSALYDSLYRKALEGDADCGGLLSYNYYSGEHITGLAEGRPLFLRTADSRFTLANFMRTLLYSAMATLKIGMDILTHEEHARVEEMLGHGGLFKIPSVGQRLMAGALGVPITVMNSAGEGGAWGIALLAAYLKQKVPGQTLEEYLSEGLSAKDVGVRIEPEQRDIQGFIAYMERYREGLAIERMAIKHLK